MGNSEMNKSVPMYRIVLTKFQGHLDMLFCASIDRYLRLSFGSKDFICRGYLKKDQ